jgi:hypothetical protein
MVDNLAAIDGSKVSVVELYVKCHARLRSQQSSTH